MSLWGLLLWGSSIISALELTAIVLFSNPNDAEPNVDLHSSNNGNTNDAHESHRLSEEINNTCSTPYISAPSSPGNGCPAVGYYSSAPTSPIHYVLSTAPRSDSFLSTEFGSFEFEFSFGFSPNGSIGNGSMSSVDELFLNGQIRPMSPLRTTQLQWQEHEENEASYHHHHRILELEDSENKEAETLSIETTPSSSASSSRPSSSGRNSKKWIFFKDLLYRSKTKARGNKKKFWSSITFTCSSSSMDEKEKNRKETETETQKQKQKRSKQVLPKKQISGKLVNSVRKHRGPLSSHELHYTSNRAQAEEIKKKTFLLYRQGRLRCLEISVCIFK